LWTKHTKKQIDAVSRLTCKSSFWMSLGDFVEQFQTLTISHSDPTFSRRILPADVIDEKELEVGADDDIEAAAKTKRGGGAAGTKGWGVIHIHSKLHARQAFFRLCQLDRKFQDRGDDKPDLEYADLTLLVVKKFKTPPTAANPRCGLEYAYMEGASGKDASIGLRLDGLRGGEYLIIYKANFKAKHVCQKLNLIFAGGEDLVHGATIKRLKASSFRSSFYTRLLERHERRIAQAAHFDPPAL